MLKPPAADKVDQQATPHPGMGFREFVAIVAAIMASNALAIDAMLPALPAIGAALGVENANQAQLVITAYLLGFGFAQLFYGPVSDRYGRKPVLLITLCFFALFSLAATLVTTLDAMLIVRALQGVAAAACRVLAVSIVRDCYSGRPMARVMSLSFIVFIIVPVIAPSIGQLIVLFGPWPWIFGFLALSVGALALWVGLRLPETLPPEKRIPLNPLRSSMRSGSCSPTACPSGIRLPRRSSSAACSASSTWRSRSSSKSLTSARSSPWCSPLLHCSSPRPRS
jgi:DHA1 family bicyclomycin/chloramphenicol resistance-like MFS transporter